MAKLTDIHLPEKYPQRPARPPKTSFWTKIKNFFLWPFRAVFWLIKKALSGIKFSVAYLFTRTIAGFKTVFGWLFKWSKKILSALLPQSPVGWIIALLALILLWQVWASVVNFPLVSPKQWQAVTLSNKQIYFGHLRELNSGYVVLENVYYLRDSEDPKKPPVLFRLEEELYKPESKLFLPKEQIVFWENLKSDSPVVQAISRFTAGQ